MQKVLNEARSLIRSEDYRLTRQREAILKYLAQNPGKHMTAEEIFAGVRKQVEVGLSTVYRTVIILEELGLVRSLKTHDGTSRYEFCCKDTSPHCHLICAECGKVVEAQCDLLGKMKEELREKYDFDVDDRSVMMFGKCSECSERRQSG